MTRAMTEAQAWREIAERIDRSENRMEFLCCSVDDLRRVGLIDWTTSNRMELRVDAHLGGAYTLCSAVEEESGEHCSSAEGNPMRVLAALFLALEAEDES